MMKCILMKWSKDSNDNILTNHQSMK
jgi:hypothetical protein